MTTDEGHRRAVSLAGLAMVGFAANSLLARGALASGHADPVGYSLVRLASGAVALALLRRLTAGGAPSGATWGAGTALAVYALAFSLSYVRIGAAAGALVLFATVPVALVAWGVARGTPPRPREQAGGLLAFAGLLALTSPGVHRPDPGGVLLMVAAGLAWAVYTVLGKHVTRPLPATAGNFVFALVVAVPLALPGLRQASLTPRGLVLAVVSGAVTSGLAYAVWYAVIPRLTPSELAIAQLSVPVLAGLGAVVVLGEEPTLRWLVAGATVLVGVGLAVWRR